MKSLTFLAITLAIVVAEPGIKQDHHKPPYINRPHPPSGGSHRFRRSPEPEPQGSIHAHGTQHTTGRDPQKQWNIDYEHKVWGNKDGSISIVAGAQKQPGHHSEGHAGIQGSIKWRRSASPEPQGSIHAHGTQHTTGRDPQKQWNVDYEHKVWGNKDGSISIVAGAQKQPGHHSEGHAGIQGSIKWRRSASPEPQGSIHAHGTQHTTGRDPQKQWNVDYEHKVWGNKDGSISIVAGAQKQPGHHSEGHAGIQGSIKWRRSASPEPQGSIHAHGTQHTAGRDPQKQWNVDYEHKVWGNKDGSISIVAGAQKQPGHHSEGHAGIQGSIKWRRSASPEPQGSIHAHGTQHTTGRDPQKQWNVDYEHKVWGNKDGSISIVAGAQKQPGHHSEGHAGIQGSIKWRRSASPEPQGSIHAHGTQHTTGRDPQKQWNVDYEHKVWGNKDGSISIVAGAQKQPGHHSEGHAGIQGSIKWRRSASPEPQGSIHAHGTQHTTGRDPQKQWNVDYEHKVWGNKDGSISIVAGAQKQPGHHSEGHAGIQGSIKWRRSASPEPQGSIHAHGTQHTTGRDPQKQWNVDYEHKVWGNKDGSISIVAGAQKQPGHHSEGHAGIQGSIKWRRSASPEPQGSIHAHGTQHTTGRDPQKQWNVDYEHKVWGNKDGSISIVAGAQKQPGHHSEGHAGIQGSIKWRRSASPEPQGSIHAHGTQHTTGRDPQKQWNVDYEHKVWGNKDGGISIVAGAQKQPGHHSEGHAGIQGSIKW